MYLEKYFPFIKYADFISNKSEKVMVKNIFIPFRFNSENVPKKPRKIKRFLNAYRVQPINLLVLNESDKISYDVSNGFYGDEVNLNITEVDYSEVANRIEVDEKDSTYGSESMVARVNFGGGYECSDIDSDIFINTASNGIALSPEDYADIKTDYTPGMSFYDLLDNETVDEASALFSDMLDAVKSHGNRTVNISDTESTDIIYKYLDEYFSLPEGEGLNKNGREVVPLLIGPTAVFKSATVKELCKKYDYRLVDFRASFTSRLDYSGLFQVSELDGEKYSYSCPMEELVTCSDGFRAYCREAYEAVSEILKNGYTLEDTTSDGSSVVGTKVPLTDKKKAKLQKLLDSYQEYMKTPVLFFDEIGRVEDRGVEGVLTTLLNKKKFNDMTLSGCKFIAATNLNINTDLRHLELKDDLDTLYQVQDDNDVAYMNRFLPIKVQPEDVRDRWFDWAKSDGIKHGKTAKNIHPLIVDFLEKHLNLVYNDSPVLDAIEQGLSQNEISSQVFPNYRTWDMLSDYLYSIDEDYEVEVKENKGAKKEYRVRTIEGLISKFACKTFLPFLQKNGYEEKDENEIEDDVGDFLSTNLDAGVPALLAGPSSLGKTSRISQYIKKIKKRTGLAPILIDVSLASKDAVDLMGMPEKEDLVEYVGGKDLDDAGLSSVGKKLRSIIKEVSSKESYGMVDRLTVRAPDINIKKRFKQALDEGRQVILFFDECKISGCTPYGIVY